MNENMSKRQLPRTPSMNNGQQISYGWVDSPQYLYNQRIPTIQSNPDSNQMSNASPNQFLNRSQQIVSPDIFQYKDQYPPQPGQFQNPYNGIKCATAPFEDNNDQQRRHSIPLTQSNVRPIGLIPVEGNSSQPIHLPTCPLPIQTPFAYPLLHSPLPVENSIQPQPAPMPYPYPGSPYRSPQHSLYSRRATTPNTNTYHDNSGELCYEAVDPYKISTPEVGHTSAIEPRNPWIKRKLNPTVVDALDFDPVKDVHDLRRAMRGFGTDENALIKIICRRSNAQRQLIQLKYKAHFGKDLIEDIKSETNGNFQRVLVGLLLPIVDYYVKELSDAMAGLGTDEDVLVEVLCTLSNAEIQTIKRAYRKSHGWTLEAELKAETSGSFKRFLVSLCTAARDESGETDPIAAFHDARDLLNAGELLRFGTDDSTFNEILCQRNFQQLRLIFQKYEHITGHAFDKAIKREFSGDIKDGLLAIYKCVMNKTEFFASRLHKSMAGLGTNNKQLIRIIITRSEIDMKDIKVDFENLYGKSLRNWIKDDITGNYKHALYAVIGEERSLK